MTCVRRNVGKAQELSPIALKRLTKLGEMIKSIWKIAFSMCEVINFSLFYETIVVVCDEYISFVILTN